MIKYSHEFRMDIIQEMESGASFRGTARKYDERLHTRNEFLINSHHPLRETLMQQNDATTTERVLYNR